ncbi:MAG TPA: sugar phosphate isomerase/epimerase family protein [Longimicrobiales bacterium]
MKRRDFLLNSLIVTAGVTGACARGLTTSTSRRRELFQISLAQWSLHRALRGGQLDHLDFARAARRDYGIDAVEYVNQFFPDKAADRAYLTEMKTRAAGEGVKSLLIMCDGEGNLGDTDAAQRTQAVERHHKWVEAARFLECHSIRVNAYSQADSYDEQMKLAADGLRRLATFAAPYEINVIVENHGGLSSNGQWLAGVIRLADHDHIGTLPDFGNFLLSAESNTWYDRYRGVEEMMPYAKAVSAKSHEFDAAGNETQTDYLRMMKIVLAHNYHGHIGIEYEGTRLSEPEGIRATRDLLLRVRQQLAAS